MSRGRKTKGAARRVAALVLAVTGALLAVAPPAMADSPPGFNGAGWAALTIDANGSLSAPRGASHYGPFTVSLTHGDGFDVVSGLGWAVNVDGLPVWWPSLSISGFELQAASECFANQSSCSYYIVSGGGEFVVQGGVPPVGESFPPTQNISLNPILPASMSIQVNQDLRPVQGFGGEPGTITLDASGTSDGFTDPGSLTYSWSIEGNGASQTASGMVATVPLAENGQYTVTLTVTNPVDGYSQVFGPSTFAVTGVAAAAPSTPIGNGGGASGGGTPSTPIASPGAGAAPTPTPAGRPPTATPSPLPVVETPLFPAPRRVPSALNGGRAGEAQVIWLWRPDWFHPGSLGPRQPQTSTPPRVKGNQTVEVSSRDPAPESSATPWLAGLAAFGVIGLGFVTVRRRRVHAEY